MESFDISCDWDGVIHSYVSGSPSRPDIFQDPPVPGAIEWLASCVMAGQTIIINSTRLVHDDEVLAAEVVESMKSYLIEEGCPSEVVHALKFWSGEGKPRAKLYIDDRAYRFEGTFPSVDEMGGMDVWNRASRIKARAEAKEQSRYDAQKLAHEIEEGTR